MDEVRLCRMPDELSGEYVSVPFMLMVNGIPIVQEVVVFPRR